MPIIEKEMSLGQLRLERARLQKVWWEYADKMQTVNAKPRVWTSGKHIHFQHLRSRRVFLQLMAIGEHLDIINEEIDNRNYEYANKFGSHKINPAIFRIPSED